ncbi:hypothetical protein PENTCL1PPCAC_9572, partial [Pristionchus entomophagus]
VLTCQNLRIYKACFISTSCTVAVSHIRDLLMDERVDLNGMVCNYRHGNLSENFVLEKFVYRLCDEPAKDGIIVDRKYRWRFIHVHRGRAFFAAHNKDSEFPSVEQLSERAFLISLPTNFMISHSRDSSKFVYLIDGHQNLYTLDTETMVFQPTVKFDLNYEVINKFTVHSGVISIIGSIANCTALIETLLPEAGYVSAHEDFDYQLKTASLPHGYFHKPDILSEAK